ncbi:hypothetical protein F5Y04DRAFT_282910 [Hypomontagnella monticulosa]|nr:hypothetical protein F5Y04DRAFT_282910 [Hypomontagnella monticulosa]
MKASSFFATILAFVAAAVARDEGTPATSEPTSPVDVPEGYTLAPMTWKGNITVDGPEVSFTGTSFQEIEYQILQANPDFKWPEVTGNGTTDASDVNKAKAWTTCTPNGVWWAQQFRIEEGIEYLRGKTGRCHMVAGPRVCTRISCSYKSGIWWCNDQPNDLWIDCSLWADYASDILDKCQSHDDSVRVRGQQFATDDWNMIVGFTDLYC